ncbi:unnamed protein product [Malus baccata var. baccata]
MSILHMSHDVRKQTGASFAQAFQKHEDTDKVARCIAALSEASKLSGWDLKNTANGHEAQFIRRIIGEITKQLDIRHLNAAVYQVGIDSRVNEINSLDGGSYDVQMVGIWGMGGMGKTSVAKAIHNKFYHSFVYKSFLQMLGKLQRNRMVICKKSFFLISSNQPRWRLVIFIEVLV